MKLEGVKSQSKFPLYFNCKQLIWMLSVTLWAISSNWWWRLIWVIVWLLSLFLDYFVKTIKVKPLGHLGRWYLWFFIWFKRCRVGLETWLGTLMCFALEYFEVLLVSALKTEIQFLALLDNLRELFPSLLCINIFLILGFKAFLIDFLSGLNLITVELLEISLLRTVFLVSSVNWRSERTITKLFLLLLSRTLFGKPLLPLLHLNRSVVNRYVTQALGFCWSRSVVARAKQWVVIDKLLGRDIVFFV
jgi:hypothetical protein